MQPAVDAILRSAHALGTSSLSRCVSMYVYVFVPVIVRSIRTTRNWTGNRNTHTNPPHQTKSTSLGSGAVVIGMPHRGRLALLAAQMDYPIRRMLHKVAGRSEFPQGGWTIGSLV